MTPFDREVQRAIIRGVEHVDIRPSHDQRLCSSFLPANNRQLQGCMPVGEGFRVDVSPCSCRAQSCDDLHVAALSSRMQQSLAITTPPASTTVGPGFQQLLYQVAVTRACRML
ncbi:unnamed protein product [Ectocarpus fasciculatus]